jgi:hypothetical protein
MPMIEPRLCRRSQVASQIPEVLDKIRQASQGRIDCRLGATTPRCNDARLGHEHGGDRELSNAYWCELTV